MGSHVGMLIFYLIADQPSLEQIARAHLQNGNFKRMVAAMSRYYEFLNLTTNVSNGLYTLANLHAVSWLTSVTTFTPLGRCRKYGTQAPDEESDRLSQSAGRWGV